MLLNSQRTLAARCKALAYVSQYQETLWHCSEKSACKDYKTHEAMLAGLGVDLSRAVRKLCQNQQFVRELLHLIGLYAIFKIIFRGAFWRKLFAFWTVVMKFGRPSPCRRPAEFVQDGSCTSVITQHLPTHQRGQVFPVAQNLDYDISDCAETPQCN
jgi:hypothetical protein